MAILTPAFDFRPSTMSDEENDVAAEEAPEDEAPPAEEAPAPAAPPKPAGAPIEDKIPELESDKIKYKMNEVRAMRHHKSSLITVILRWLS